MTKADHQLALSNALELTDGTTTRHAYLPENLAQAFLEVREALQKLSDGVTEFCESEVDAYELLCDPNEEAIELLKKAKTDGR